MDRALLALCGRYIEYQYFALTYNPDLHVFLLKQANADCVPVPHAAPKISLQLVYICIRQIIRPKFI